MRILIESVPHDQQRYETCGDYTSDGETLTIKVSHTLDDYDFLIAVHELVEAYLCQKRGISGEVIDAFDMAYEAKRPEGNTDEPGFDNDCPYRREHRFATGIERQIARELGVDWSRYEQRIHDLSQKAKA